MTRAQTTGDRGEPARSGTRLRVVPALAVGFLSLIVIKSLIASSALAVNFTTSDRHFKVYSNYVQGVYGAGFTSTNNGTGPTDDQGVEEIGFKTAKLSGLCMITTQDVGFIGTTSVIITGGVPVKGTFNHGSLVASDANGDPITLDANGLLTGQSLANAVDVQDMYLSTEQIKAYGNKFSGMNVGQSAPQAATQAGLEWKTDHGGTAPQAGQGGLMAIRMNLGQLDGGSYGIEMAGGMRLPNLQIRSIKGVATQADCAGGGTP